jgi:hypothetical protein
MRRCKLTVVHDPPDYRVVIRSSLCRRLERGDEVRKRKVTRATTTDRMNLEDIDICTLDTPCKVGTYARTSNVIHRTIADTH